MSSSRTIPSTSLIMAFLAVTQDEVGVYAADLLGGHCALLACGGGLLHVSFEVVRLTLVVIGNRTVTINTYADAVIVF